MVDEITSNALRHGAVPVELRLSADGTNWLVAVTDHAPAVPPVPAVGRAPGGGGYGLYMVADLTDAHGWHGQDHSKTVWALLDPNGAGPSRRLPTDGDRPPRGCRARPSTASILPTRRSSGLGVWDRCYRCVPFEQTRRRSWPGPPRRNRASVAPRTTAQRPSTGGLASLPGRDLRLLPASRLSARAACTAAL